MHALPDTCATLVSRNIPLFYLSLFFRWHREQTYRGDAAQRAPASNPRYGPGSGRASPGGSYAPRHVVEASPPVAVPRLNLSRLSGEGTPTPTLFGKPERRLIPSVPRHGVNRENDAYVHGHRPEDGVGVYTPECPVEFGDPPPVPLSLGVSPATCGAEMLRSGWQMAASLQTPGRSTPKPPSIPPPNQKLDGGRSSTRAAGLLAAAGPIGKILPTETKYETSWRNEVD